MKFKIYSNFQERLQACLVQYLSDESEKEEKPAEITNDAKSAEVLDVIVVEDDSGDEEALVPIKKKRHRSTSGSRDRAKVLKTERRVVVDMTRDRPKEKRREPERRRDEVTSRSREESKRDERTARKITDERTKDIARKKEEERKKEMMRREESRKREHDRR